MATDIQVIVQDDSAHVTVETDAINVVTVSDDQQVVVEDTSIVVVSVGEQGPPGPSGGAYVRATPMAITVGGAVPGTMFGSTVEAALDTILYPYLLPAFSSFSFSQASPLEVGDSMPAGSKTFSWAFTNASNVAANTLDLSDNTGATTIATNISNTSPAAYAIGAVTKTSATAHTWGASATNTLSGAFSSTFSVNWYWRTCYGESALTSLTSADILALRVTGLSNTINGTKAFLGGGYKWICYPTTFGLKTTFKDTATNLDVAMVAASTIAVTNSFGIVQNYYAHRTLNILGGAISIAVS